MTNDDNVNLASIIAETADSEVALIDGSTRISYGELRDRVARTAGSLIEAGLAPGDRVVVLAGNEPAFVVGLLGAWHAGLAAVLINHQEPVPQLEQYLSSIETQAILASATQQSVEAAQALAAAGHGSRFVATPALCGGGDLPECNGPAVPMASRRADDHALFIFTSGVSGLPRPAVLTHGNLGATHAGLAARAETQLSTASVSLGALPMVHILGLNVAVLSTLRNGGTTVLQNHWSAEQAMSLIGEHGIDTLVLVPAMWSDLASVAGASPSSVERVKLARCGAATLTPAVAEQVHAVLGIDLAQGYGLTETAGTVTFEPNARLRPGSVGTALDSVEIRIIDADGEVDAEPGDPGEIWVRGDCVFGGYWGEPELNAELFSADGWYRTGDIGVFDDRLYLVGRQKDMISVSGFKISPVEVELTLEGHESVSGALVVGEADDRTGERVVAYVVAETGVVVEASTLQDHVRASLARYKVPKAVYVVEELPANVIGKRIRRGLVIPTA
ncbi:MAG: class I adenylate-forming enzyme family protein [Acidimicrobiales bacterium]